MKTFEDAQAVLAQSLPGYETRPQQRALAQAVERAMAGRHHLLAEAGTGCGKSLGYLIPSILSGKRAVISTATKALQEQIAGKDLPFLAEHLGVDFRYALLKGRTNYVCMAKVNGPDAGDIMGIGDVRDVIAERGQEPDFLGERDDFPIEDRDWRKLTTTSEECPGKRECPFGEVCFAERAKARAAAADVVVVNHALYLTDLKVRMSSGGFASMLGNHDVVVFDEAHEIEEYAGGIFGDRVTEAGIRDTMTKVLNFVRRTLPEDDDTIRTMIADVTSSMSRLWAVLPAGRIYASQIAEHGEEFTDLINALGAIVDYLNDVRVQRAVADPGSKLGDKALGAYGVLRNTVTGHYQKVYNIVFGEAGEWVRWTEDERMSNGSERRVMKIAPVSVADILRENLFEQQASAILASATLSVGGNFDYIRSRLGIDDADQIDVGTPFDYPKQARLYVPTHLPDPTPANRAAWESQMIVEMGDLVRMSDGRALLLFTSFKGMRMAYDFLAPRLPYTCLMQGQMNNKALAAAFTEDTHSVLFATRSFMTGVDFQGETCSLVVVDKLPFPVPTEALTQARCEAIKARGGNDFGEYTIPVMTLVLKQAFGRLIRHKGDAGVVAILDPRLVTKGYGKTIVRALPDAPLLRHPSEVQAFYDGLKEA